MDLKEPGNLLYLVGVTKDELGGSHFALVEGLAGGEVPTVDPPLAKRHVRRGARGDRRRPGPGLSRPERRRAGRGRGRNGLRRRLGRSLVPGAAPHAVELDAATLAKARQMAARVSDDEPPPIAALPSATAILLFAESNSRFLCEVRPENAAAFEADAGRRSARGASARSSIATAWRSSDYPRRAKRGRRRGRASRSGCGSSRFGDTEERLAETA